MKRYPEDVHAFIAENVQGTTTADLITLVNTRFGTHFTESKMRSYKKNHGLKSGIGCGIPAGTPTKQYPSEVREFIKSNYVGVGHQGMADLLNERFGTNYTKGQMKAIYSRFKLNSGRTGRFPKGSVPPNKGKKGYCAPGSEKGWFPKGNRPRNIREVGAEVLRTDGYMYIKIAEPNKWRQKHVLAWEAVNGPKPKGHKLIFGDGNRMNFDLDNLILVTDGQMAVMNKRGLVYNNADLTRTGVLIADVTMKIYERRNPMKKHATDEEIFALIDEGKKNAEIARHFGVSQPSINKRINNLRMQHEYNIKIGEAKNKVESESEGPISVELAQEKAFPFEPKENVIFAGKLHTVSSVWNDRIVLRENASLKPVTVKFTDYNADRASIRKVDKKPPIKTAGEDMVLKQRKEVEDPNAGHVGVLGARLNDLPDACKKKIAEKLKSDAKRFEAARAMEIENIAEKILTPQKPQPELKESVEVLFQPDPAENAIESAPADAGPLHIDLEIDPISDPEPFRAIDYTDSDWGVAEKEISDTVLSRREYLDKIDQLLDLMAPVCRANPLLKIDVINLARSVMETGFDAEIKEAGA